MQLQAQSHNSPTTELLLHYIADEETVVRRDKVTGPARSGGLELRSWWCKGSGPGA